MRNSRHTISPYSRSVQQRASGGFTFIEVIIVIAVLSLLVGVLVTSFPTWIKRTDVNNVSQELANVLRLAQSKAVSSEATSPYGVYINTSSSPHQYTMFKGANYATRDVSADKTYVLPSKLEFYNVSFFGGGNEVVFDRIIGTTAQPGSVNIRIKAEPDINKDVCVSGAGTISFNCKLFVAVAFNTSDGGYPVMTSYDGITWTTRNSLDISWIDITYGNGLFVAVGLENEFSTRIMTSYDGITWTLRSNPSPDWQQWSSITYGQGLFVVVGDQNGPLNYIMTSPDGITWTLRNIPSGRWNSVAYGNGLFVTVGCDVVNCVGSKAMVSSDGIAWIEVSSPLPEPTQDVTYGNGLFVAVASGTSNNSIMTSPDGINWTLKTAFAKSWFGITYGNGLYVVVGTGSGGQATDRVMTSPDANTWTQRNVPENAKKFWLGVTYDKGLFVAVAQYGGPPGHVMTSYDGITWTLRNSLANSWYDVAHLDSSASDFERIKDSRHTHVNYNRAINTLTENIVLNFNNGEVVQTYPISAYLAGGQIEIKKTISVGGTDQTIVIKTHNLNSPTSQFSIHRDRSLNDKSLKITLQADATGNLIEYSADGSTVNGVTSVNCLTGAAGLSIYVSNCNWQ